MTPSNEHDATKEGDPARFKVAKCGYSCKPWRIVDTHTPSRAGTRGHHPDGTEIWRMEAFDHSSLGPITVPSPVAFDRKRDALVALSEFLAAADRSLHPGEG